MNMALLFGFFHVTWEDRLGCRQWRARNEALAEIGKVPLLFRNGEQVQQLVDDDWSYYNELQEELDYELELMIG